MIFQKESSFPTTISFRGYVSFRKDIFFAEFRFLGQSAIICIIDTQHLYFLQIHQFSVGRFQTKVQWFLETAMGSWKEKSMS